MLPKGLENRNRCNMTSTPTRPQTNLRRMGKWVGGIISFLCLAGLAISAPVWSFRESAVVKDLEEQSFSKVTVGRFHQTYFPRPGCDLEQVVFRHNLKTGAAPLITIQHLRIE